VLNSDEQAGLNFSVGCLLHCRYWELQKRQGYCADQQGLARLLQLVFVGWHVCGTTVSVSSVAHPGFDRTDLIPAALAVHLVDCSYGVSLVVSEDAPTTRLCRMQQR
jgi:hypothetical protein